MQHFFLPFLLFFLFLFPFLLPVAHFSVFLPFLFHFTLHPNPPLRLCLLFFSANVSISSSAVAAPSLLSTFFLFLSVVLSFPFFYPSSTLFLFFYSYFASFAFLILFPLFPLFSPFLPFFIFFTFYLCNSLTPSFSCFTPLPMFHVKHHFSHFPVLILHGEAVFLSSSFVPQLFFVFQTFKTFVFFLPFLCFYSFFLFFPYFRMFHTVLYFPFLRFIKLFNYVFVFLYKLNFLIRFFVFSEPFTKPDLGPLFSVFSPVCQDFISFSYFQVFVVIRFAFFLIFHSYVNYLVTRFIFGLHNHCCPQLPLQFAQLSSVFSLFPIFPFIFALYLSPFSLIMGKKHHIFPESIPFGRTLKGVLDMKHSKKLVTLSVLTTMSGAAIYFLNKTLDTAAIRKNLLAATEKEIFSWQFGDIFYTKKGTGTPMLLLHDLHCASSGREWQYIEDTLAQDHTVYTLDLLGCGRSDKPAITYTNFLYVQLIVTFIKQVIGCPTDVIASGLSGSFVVTACNTAPKCFGRIMMINPTDLAKLNKIPDKRSRFLKRMIELPLVGTLLYHTLTGRSNIELLFTESYYHNPFHRSPEDVDAFYESAHLQSSAGKYLFASLAGNYVNLNIGHALKHIDNSIFLIGGEEEPGIAETFALYTALNTSIETQILPKTKHMPQMEAPQALLDQIQIFFAPVQ